MAPGISQLVAAGPPRCQCEDDRKRAPGGPTVDLRHGLQPLRFGGCLLPPHNLTHSEYSSPIR